MKIEKLILSARNNAKLLTGLAAASWWDFNYFPIVALLPIIACRGFPLFFSRQSVLPSFSLSLFLFRFRALFVFLSPSSRIRQPAYLSPYNRFIYLLPLRERAFLVAAANIPGLFCHRNGSFKGWRFRGKLCENVFRGNTIRRFTIGKFIVFFLLLFADG